MNERERKWLFRIIFFLILSLFVYMVLQLKVIWFPIFKMLKAVLIPFMLSGFITYLLHPVVEKLYRSGVPRTCSILIIYFIFFGGVGFSFYKGVPIFVEQMKDLSENIPMFTKYYQSWTDKIHDGTTNLPGEIHHRIESFIAGMETSVAAFLERMLSSMKSIIDYAVIIGVIPFLVFYMLKDYEKMKKAIWYFTPKKWRREGRRFLENVDESLGSYLRGQLFVCFLIGLSASILFWLFKIKYPLILGTIIGMTNIIPYFGPFIGAVPALMVAATLSINKIIVVLFIIFGLQFIESNILGPFIVGKSLHMHPMVIIMALLAGGEIGGVIGLILAVPFITVLKEILLHIILLRKAH
ncbi:AI-2E family transporter [Aeribacillus sp. FSL M8-0254]|uniref:AI-2E family transporter n=1 Tax=Aeribacillus sp. FSL M8-0254 TaxID=2954577 RepID=UPI0030FC926B